MGSTDTEGCEDASTSSRMALILAAASGRRDLSPGAISSRAARCHTSRDTGCAINCEPISSSSGAAADVVTSGATATAGEAGTGAWRMKEAAGRGEATEIAGAEGTATGRATTAGVRDSLSGVFTAGTTKAVGPATDGAATGDIATGGAAVAGATPADATMPSGASISANQACRICRDAAESSVKHKPPDFPVLSVQTIRA